MKGFLAKRWHGIPFGILTAALLVCLRAASAFAAYKFFTGSATVTVNEAITWGNATGDGGWDNAAGKWTVSIYPNETKNLKLGLYNAGSVDIVAHVTFAGTPDGLTPSGSGDYNVPAGSGVWVNLSVTASSSSVPSVYTIPLTMTR